MPRYHFNLRCGDTVQADELGNELPSDAAAFEEALSSAKELVIQRIRKHTPLGLDAYEVRSDANELLHTVPLRSVVLLD